MVNERKARPVNRAIFVGGAPILAVLVYLLATGSPLAGVFLADGADCALGYGLVHFVLGRLGDASSVRGRLTRTAALALVAVLAMTAGSFVDLQFSAADLSLDLFADGFFFGVAFAAVVGIFGPLGDANAR